ncbi:hypothetical protein AB4Y30_11445 [Ornithinibacillus sp. 4-3]|uniref:Phage tail protein n=1 Tax=Ornithinibacillus sp. 4-3 TaxID=3231488 RepID=A0AB39HN14_9BACI
MTDKLQAEHKSLTLVVEIEGKDQRFVSPKKIPGVLWRQAAMVAEEIESGEVLVSDLDSHLQFVCDVFGNQFSLDQLEEGVDARDLVKVVYAVTIFVMGQVSVAAEMLTSNVDIADINEKKGE